ncbi:ABC transporter substrate-binding protein [bacterium]|nr:ABC transporter substrate-binding protein [bacterium]MBU1752587.1 ABC transporter substrate-binding protein [bacterium]
MKGLMCVCIVLFGILSICHGGSPSGTGKRIISLSPPLTEQLYLLGVEDRLVGVTTYCKRPPEAEKKEKVASCRNANMERIIALTPDLVLASPLSNPAQIQKLRDMGIGVVTFPTPKNFASLCDGFLQLSRLVGKEKEAAPLAKAASGSRPSPLSEAEKMVRQVKKRVDVVSKKVSKGIKNKPAVFVQVGAKPLFTVTKNSFINEFIEVAGGINIAYDAKTGLYSLEKVIQKDPDIIIIATMGIVGEEEKKNWEKYKTMKAVKNKRIYIMDSCKLCSPTPVSYAGTLEEMIRILNFSPIQNPK